MKAVCDWASKVMSGVFIACVALALVGYAYGDPGEDDDGTAPLVCTGCTKAQTSSPLDCLNCDAVTYGHSPGAFCYNGVNPNNPNYCQGHTAGSCDSLCACKSLGGGTYGCK
jgi:hypothetical protein